MEIPQSISNSLLQSPELLSYSSHLTDGAATNGPSETKCGRSSGVEHNLAKVRVVSSNLIARSSFSKKLSFREVGLFGYAGVAQG